MIAAFICIYLTMMILVVTVTTSSLTSSLTSSSCLLLWEKKSCKGGANRRRWCTFFNGERQTKEFFSRSVLTTDVFFFFLTAAAVRLKSPTKNYRDEPTLREPHKHTHTHTTILPLQRRNDDVWTKSYSSALFYSSSFRSIQKQRRQQKTNEENGEDTNWISNPSW